MNFYILCKNEAPNIKKCIESLLNCGMDVVVMDSGSTDDTLRIISAYPVTLVNYKYTNHCDAYNQITSSESNNVCGIFDADMEMTSELAVEISNIQDIYDVIKSPVQMYVEGVALKRGSLYPPKPIVFRTGKAYFETVGHGERLKSGVRVAQTKSALKHNDLKNYFRFLESQVRYAEKLADLAIEGRLTWRDKLRVKTPFMLVIAPLYSLFVRGGVFSQEGWLYAIDRLIAEAIMYHRSLRRSVRAKKWME